MMENKENAKLVGWVVGMLIGMGVGLAMGNIAIGSGIGVSLGMAFAKQLSGEDPKGDKKTKRRTSWIMLGSMTLGCVVFGIITGHILEGFASAIGLSFVVGLKWEQLYDERMSSMFSKAARNAFVVINAGFTFIVFFNEVIEYSFLAAVPFIQQLKSVIYISWAVFLVSWVYHANYKGE